MARSDAREHDADADATADAALRRDLFGGDATLRRRAVAKAITLVESTHATHRQRAQALLVDLAAAPASRPTLRIGISGSPGVGKSTFIEALGLRLMAEGRRVAVLAVDPSSSVSGGSILGDKTRMERLSMDPRAFVRPSPSSGTLGGVAASTGDAIRIVEAAGFDVVVVETVGVGQSEDAVAGLVDCFVLLQLPNAGDDLQAIKKGVLELADVVVVNKADLDPAAAARAAGQLASSMRRTGPGGQALASPEVLQTSAIDPPRVAQVWRAISSWAAARRASGEWEARRRGQSVNALQRAIDAALADAFRGDPDVRAAWSRVLADVERGRLPVAAAAQRLVDVYAEGRARRGHASDADADADADAADSPGDHGPASDA